jgi:hypothetical protein
MLTQFASLGSGEDGGRFAVNQSTLQNTVTADGCRHKGIQLLPVILALPPSAFNRIKHQI